MADYFTNFSFTIAFANAQHRDDALKLFHAMSALQQGEDIPPAFPDDLRDACEDCFFEAQEDGPQAIWVHSESGGIDAVCAYVWHLVRKFSLKPVAFEWSHDCSKPRTDAYGGGAAYITATEVKSMSTAQWLRQQSGPNANPA